MKIILLDTGIANPGDMSWDRYWELGDITIYPDSADIDVAQAVKDADIVLGNCKVMDETTLGGAEKLKYIGVFSTGYNHIDMAYVRKRGITVTNVPSYGTEIVAQYAISLLLEICGHVSYYSGRVHSGEWLSSRERSFIDHPVIELNGKTMGIIGFGRIGKTAGKIARAFGMTVLYNDSVRSPELESETCRFAELDELFAKSDVVELHCPLFPETEGIINRETIGKMKDGVIIINNSRGKLVVDKDLADALVSGKVYAAGLDVVSQEPIPEDSPLLKAPNCFVTPHLSWVSKEARQRMMDTVLENLKSYLAGKPVNVVS